jgi:hypothetical protein
VTEAIEHAAHRCGVEEAGGGPQHTGSRQISMVIFNIFISVISMITAVTSHAKTLYLARSLSWSREEPESPHLMIIRV